jgi:hypothetical protein
MTWAPIRYRDFWDVPRIFLVEYEGVHFLFDCAFDEETEDYPDTYTVYLVPSFAEAELSGSWHLLPQRASRVLQRVPVASVKFDPTMRKAIDTALLAELTGAAGSREPSATK